MAAAVPRGRDEAGPRLDFVPATVVADPAATPDPVVPTSGGVIETGLVAGARMRITGIVDERAAASIARRSRESMGEVPALHPDPAVRRRPQGPGQGSAGVARPA